jgi:hypothetical protein
MVASRPAHAVTILVPDIDSGAEILRVTSLGAVTASNVGYGNHVVGPAGVADEWSRPIIQFPVSSFASLAGLSVVSATLHYSIISDFTEPGESASSEVRLFTTSETALGIPNRNIFAGLSGDGGAHTVVGSATVVDGVIGAQSLAFSAAALTALEAAINGLTPTLVISFREFTVPEGIGRTDVLDEFVLGVPPGNVSIEITAVPEPGLLAMLAMGGLAMVRSRRTQR